MDDRRQNRDTSQLMCFENRESHKGKNKDETAPYKRNFIQAHNSFRIYTLFVALGETGNAALSFLRNKLNSNEFCHERCVSVIQIQIQIFTLLVISIIHIQQIRLWIHKMIKHL